MSDTQLDSQPPTSAAFETVPGGFGADTDLGFRHPIDELAAAVADEEGVAIATGLSGSYAAAALRQLQERVDRPIVVVTPTLTAARELAADLAAFGVGGPAREVLTIPPEDVSPYGEVSPDRNRIMERLNTQFRLAMGDDWRVVLLPVAGAMRKVVPWSVIEDASTLFSVGDQVDLDRLRRVLSDGGYSSVRLVEDPGTYAIRGGLIDVYSPYDQSPVRIELWGDEVESIREFDPQTQLTREARSDVFIFPVREEIVTAGALARAREHILAAADAQQLPSSLVGELMRDLESGYNFFGIESLLPALFELGSPLDLMPQHALWVVFEPAEIESRLAEGWERRRQEHARFLNDGDGLAFPPEAWFDSPDVVVQRLSAKRPRIELHPTTVPDGPAFTFAGHGNDDVIRLRKMHDETEGAVHALVGRLDRWRGMYGRIAFACRTLGTSERLATLLRHYGQRVAVEGGPIPVEPLTAPPAEVLSIYTAEVTDGFRSPALSLAVIPDAAIFGRTPRRASTRVVEETMAVSHFRELTAGDLVVHMDFGIARYHGIEKLEVGGVAGDYLKLEFAGEDKLYLPIYRLGRVQKHVGGEAAGIALDKLGGTRWEKTKSKVKADLQKLAAELLALYAERSRQTSFGMAAPDDYYHEFEATFPFEETPHQETAIHEVLADMWAPRPMDRLLCGDVGFGKTEVAIRAAFLAAMTNGKQVAVLVPTTILAEQHARTFTDRLQGYPVKVAALSRFRTAKEQREILDEVAAGRIDILIGTHRILSRDVAFRDLGLLVVDEEQRFGVKHKERLKQLKKMVDVLAMTATPIPRTLEMSLLGIRDLSIILTPPTDRLAVRTHVAQFGEAVIREGIESELRRGGQVFFVNNRVRGIAELAETVRECVPHARVAVGHAQMSNTKLEKVMLDFVGRKTDVLVCTTIIESGLDIGSANTIFINRADSFGLAQLYQLRGRVGRGRERAFCYLLVPRRRRLPPDAARRLEVIRTNTELGSGLYIAQHDLDIRGAGDLLGKDQSGHIRTIGYDLFCELLEETIAEQRGQPVESRLEPEVKIPVAAYLPTEYIADEGLRLLFYKRLSLARSNDELDQIIAELIDRFGRPPREVAHLREVISLKIALAELGIETLEAGPSAIVFTLAESCRLSPDRVVSLVQREQGRFVLSENMQLIRYLGGREGEDLLAASRSVVERVRTCLPG